MTSLTKTFTKAFEKDESHVHIEIKAKPYSNPYLVGIGLGLVLLAAFVIMGRGLGASGAVSTAVAVTVNTIAPSHASGNQFYTEYLGDGKTSPFKDWLVFEVLGVIAGGFLSGSLAHRVKKGVDKGPRVSNRTRLIYAFVGGGLMGFGAKLARGCTSGQALSGGAILNLGSWAFMMMVFAGGYAAAYFLRRQWL
ncbi:MAG: YeeE/YedE family protein [Ignavibacteriales bacterium]|nr:YeeE/YedE family protein [Ignavibacteriales bacterium]